MKKRLALLTVIAASAVAYTALRNKKKVDVKEEVEEKLVEVKPIELPQLPKDSALSSTLLESYRVQCQVMMDGYPEDMKIDLIHHIDVKDSQKVMELAQLLRANGYEVEDQIENLSLQVTETIETSAQSAFNQVVKCAEIVQKEKAMYGGWVLDNCR